MFESYILNVMGSILDGERYIGLAAESTETGALFMLPAMNMFCCHTFTIHPP